MYIRIVYTSAHLPAYYKWYMVREAGSGKLELAEISEAKDVKVIDDRRFLSHDQRGRLTNKQINITQQTNK